MTDKERERLIEDARAGGYTLRMPHSGCQIIAQLTPKRKTVRRGVVLFDDGSAIDLTVPLDIAKSLRNVSVIRKVLGLPS